MALRDVLRLVRGGSVHLGNLTAVLAGAYGDRPLLVDPDPTPGIHPGGERTANDTEFIVARYAAAFRGLGIDAGQRVMILVGNRTDVVLLAAAVARLEAIAAPVNPRLKPQELDAVAAATGATLVLADAAVRDELEGAFGPKDLDWLTLDDPDGDVQQWLDGHPDESLSAPHTLDVDEVVILLCTSGTTGLPKAAALTSAGLLTSVGLLAVAPVGMQSGIRADRDRVLAALPQVHIMGLGVTLAAMAAGVPLLHQRRFDAKEAFRLIESARPNVFVGVPTMYADLEAHGVKRHDLSSIQLFVSAADVMPVSRIRAFQRLGGAAKVLGRGIGNATFVDAYGMVELSGAAALRIFPPAIVPSMPTPGFALVLPGMEARVVDEEGDRVGWGRVGELQFRGAGVLSRYEGRADATDDEGWFATGDYARLWPGKLITLAGRKRDRLKIGGFSVFPAEVEESLRAHPDVLDLAYVGVEDDRLGDRPVVLVVPRSAKTFDAGEFLAWCREEVAGYRRPHAVHVVEALPRGGNEKLDRTTATQMAEELEG